MSRVLLTAKADVAENPSRSRHHNLSRTEIYSSTARKALDGDYANVFAGIMINLNGLE
jgi:hypothetical protein